MAHLFEEGREGTQTGVAKPATDVNQWLKANRLTVLIAYFEKNEIVMEDLMSFTEEDIDAFGEHADAEQLKLSPLILRKFKTAWRKLKNEQPQSASSPVTPAVVVISKEEKNAMNTLEMKLAQMNQMMEANVAKQAKVTADSKRLDSEIDDVFGVYVSKLTERAMELKKKLNKEAKEQLETLVQQQAELKKCKESAESGLSDQRAMIMDAKMDDKKRETKMLQITEDILQAINEDNLKVYVGDIVFTHDDAAVSKVISAIGSVSGIPAPPSLDISQITSAGALVKLQCTLEDAVVYRLRYRPEAGDDDDEKENEWVERTLDEGVNEHQLDGLQMKSRYEICGMYQVVNSSLWSQISQTMSFMTNAFNYKFEWDPSMMGNDVELSNNNTTMKRTTRSSYRAVVAKTTLRVNELLSAVWDITIDDLDSSLTFYQFVGFVDSNVAGKIDLNGNYHFGKKGEYVLGCYDPFYSVMDGKRRNFDSKWKNTNVKRGDRFQLKFDFEKGKCSVFFNNQYVGLIADCGADGMPEEIYLVQTSHHPATMTSTFKAVPRVKK